MGYYRAGFEIVGVDIESQPHYPFEFVRGDAIGVLECIEMGLWDRPSAIHASPPCQAYSSIRRLGKGAGEGAPDLVAEVRGLLVSTALPYVIENVVGSPLRHPVQLCGSAFGLGVRRHRWFETNVPLMAPGCVHGQQPESIAVYGDHPQDPSGRSPRRAKTLVEGQRAMGIDWMPWDSLTQAIPPAYTEHIGGYLMAHLEQAVAA